MNISSTCVVDAGHAAQWKLLSGSVSWQVFVGTEQLQENRNGVVDNTELADGWIMYCYS